jgi:gliding motility-associated-like protein
MNITNKYTGFEKLLQEKFSNLNLPYEHKDWLDFEKNLPKSPKSFHLSNFFFKHAIIAAVIVVPVLTTLYFLTKTSNHENVKSEKNIKENQLNKDDEKNVVQLNNIEKSTINTTDNKRNNSSAITTISNGYLENTSQKSNYNGEDKTNPNLTIDKISTFQNKNPENSPDNKNQKTVFFSGELIYADIVEGCAPLKVQFKPLLSSDTISYLWEFGDGKTSAKKTPAHIYSKSGTYTVSLIVKFAKSLATTKITYSKNIIVKEAPAAEFDYSLDSENDIFSFSDNSINSFNYFWAFGDKSSSKEKNPQHEYQQNGTYNVRLIVMNASGCTDTSIKKISVRNKNPFEIPNAFTPNGLNPYFGPVGENMNPDGYKISIYDKNGKIVFETKEIEMKWNGKIFGMNSDAQAGVYLWKIAIKNKYGILQDYNGWVTLIR